MTCVRPPSTSSVSPVTNRDMSLARNSAAIATSSGVPRRPRGVNALYVLAFGLDTLDVGPAWDERVGAIPSTPPVDGHRARHPVDARLHGVVGELLGMGEEGEVRAHVHDRGVVALFEVGLGVFRRKPVNLKVGFEDGGLVDSSTF